MTEEDVLAALNAPDLTKTSPEVRAFISKLIHQLLGTREDRDEMRRLWGQERQDREKLLRETSGL